jgi:hypothetical protein
MPTLKKLHGSKPEYPLIYRKIMTIPMKIHIHALIWSVSKDENHEKTLFLECVQGNDEKTWFL